MERPNDETVRHFQAGLPNDARCAPGKMFGHPCAFTGGQMFYGTYAQTLVARVGEARAAALIAADSKLRTFEPMPGRPWREYIQWDPTAHRLDEAAVWIREALEHTASLPPKAERKPSKRK